MTEYICPANHETLEEEERCEEMKAREAALELNVGDRIHGFAGGFFGRDSYDCRTVEHVGRDWVITRNTKGNWESTSLIQAWAAASKYGERKQDYDGNWCCN